MEKRCARRLVRANVLLTAGRMLLALRGLREGIACVEQALDEYQQALDEVLARIEPSTESAGIGPAGPSAGPHDLGCAGPSAGPHDLERKCADPSAGPRDLERAATPGRNASKPAEVPDRNFSKCAEDPNRRFRRRVEEALSEEDWLMLDSCRARIDATVETCRNLGYRAGRGSDGAWRVRFGL